MGKVTGAARYPADLQPDDVLHARVVFSGRPHARMVSMDTSAAEATPGVVAVFTAADVPVNEYGLTMFDQPVMVGLGGTGRSRVAADISRWDADQIAIVVAETRDAADGAAERIDVEWEDLPVVGDLDAALTGDVLVRPDLHPESNVYVTYRLRKGDVAEGWQQAEVVIEGSYEVPYQEHAYLQPEAAVSSIDEAGRITVSIAGQWTHEDQEQIAHALDLPPDQIRVIYPAIGGAFGGREDMSLQIVMALASWRLAGRGEHRPIRCQWSREESMVGHHKRHRGRVRARWGATADGRIVVAEATCHLDAGAYNYTTNKVLGNLHLCVSGPYEIPNLAVDSHGVLTNAVPGGAFRGFGAPQGAFVAETQMNKLAERLGIDPVELRLRNSLRDGSTGPTGTEMPPGVSLPVVIDRCAAAANWGQPAPELAALSPFASLPPDAGTLRRGRGFACGFKNVGFSFGFPERCEARLVLHGGEDGLDAVERVELFHSGAEVGQGAHTAFIQMAAEAVGVPVEQVDAVFSDTALTGDSGSASASRLTWMSGNAILGAAEEAEKRWRAGDRPAVGEFRFVPPPTESLNDIDSQGTPNFAYTYGAQVIDLTVDIETGHLVVNDAICAVDAGKAINPDLVAGQIEGGVVQAHGYAITEDLQVRDARIVNPRLSTYLMPGILDIPRQVTPVIVEEPDPRGPWGARGVAEVPMIPYAPAVVAALHDATGVWFDSFPLTPDRVVAGLRANGIGGPPDVG
ncbi:MAG TPA: xanthine dehydrogenase family protein molybdopterin-binding subunit [Acidimicrobiales bacterium]|nr:xanthine dehydrogenase family protein molybdopterin-binding subunit [Acidimicrobiales bacterium]